MNGARGRRASRSAPPQAHSGAERAPAAVSAALDPAVLLAWYDRHGRKDLPWQIERNAYRVWVSEIMLQQTQVGTVIPYFERFVARFPDVESVAAADADAVIAQWAGLGYYARARNLHRAAQIVAGRYGGEFPADLAALEALPGIGRSTAGAILSLGLGRRAAILDGNVKRVLCRFAGIRGWPGASLVNRELWRLAEASTPERRAGDYNQAMMDLGALICLPRAPRCGACPLAEGCQARALDLTGVIPAARPRRELPTREAWLLILRREGGEVFLQHRPPVGIWGGLWSLPEFASEAELAEYCQRQGLPWEEAERLPRRRHGFTHFTLDFVPVLAPADAIAPTRIAEGGSEGWFRIERATALPAPIRRLLNELDAPAAAIRSEESGAPG